MSPTGRNSYDVILVQPDSGDGTTMAATMASSENLGLGYLAEVLERRGFSTWICDLGANPTLEDELLESVSGKAPCLVGFSPASVSAPRAVALTRAIHRLSPNTVLAWGGHLATALGTDLFNECPDVSLVVTGMAERIFGAVVESIVLRNRIPQHHQLLVGPTSPVPMGGMLVSPGPSWIELVPIRPSTRESYQNWGARVLSSVGCPFDCAFCTTPTFTAQKVQRRDLDHLFAELEALQRDLGATQFWFNDDLFVTPQRSSRDWVLSFAQRFGERFEGSGFRAMVRADTFRGFPELLDALVAGGMNAAFVGLESGDAVGLTSLNKRTSVDDNRWIAEELESRGVVLQAGFITYSPDDTVGSIVRSANFLQSIAELYRLHPLTRTASIFPGTALWRMSNETGLWDRDRSNAFLRYPDFEDPAVRKLSRAFQEIEIVAAPVDRALYVARGMGRISWRERRRIGELVLEIFLGAVGQAVAGLSERQIIDRVAARIPELEAEARIYADLTRTPLD